MVTALLEVKSLTVDFIGENKISHAVRDISFIVNPGEIVAIVGESGSGKSVTALSILGLVPKPPAEYPSGEILFTWNDEMIDLLKASPDKLRSVRGNAAAMIFQEPMSSLNPVVTCGQQVTESLRLHKKMSKTAARLQTINLFEQVKLPQPELLFNKYPHQLSGGQKQRVMIAMAISCDPALLICDEPTTALDVTVQKSVLDLIRELQRSHHMGVILITHDLGIVADIADRAIVMYKGQIVEQGAIPAILHSPDHPYTKALLKCRPLFYKKPQRLPVVSDFLQEPKQNNLKPEPAGISRQEEEPKSEQADIFAVTEPLMRIRNLEVSFETRRGFGGKAGGQVKAIDNVSFEIFDRETLGIVGESGCGKTTLGRALLRLINPTAGSILFKGKDLDTYTSSEMKALRKDVQIIFQDPYGSLNPRLTIGAAIHEALDVHHILPSKATRNERVHELLEKVSLDPDHANRYPHEFSGGQRQRIVIARALALNPSFVVCDESVSALDVSVQAQVLNLLNDLKREFGFTTVFISHDLSVVKYMSDRILVMNKGKIEEIGDAASVYENPQQAYTKKLIDAIPGKMIY